MDINDYKGISYFRFLVPAIFIISWSGMFLGAQFAPLAYRKFSFVCYIYVVLKFVYQITLAINMVLKGNAALERAKNQDKRLRPVQAMGLEIYHAFVIPSYKEDLELLAETLMVLSKHERAMGSYLVFLAMEEHQKDSDIKAQQLIARFKSKFRHMDYTVHKLREFQSRGKASNASWCVENMEEKLQKIMINSEDVFVTVMDADSWAPNAYFNEVEDHIYSNIESRHLCIYQPMQIHSRNNMDVPIFVRTYEDMYAGLHASSLGAFTGPTYAFSNYTMSYSLLKRIGFWDTVEQAIAEDFHMGLKAHFKTNGEAKGVPIFIPFNQLNIQTGNGYVADIKAKFMQLERHARGLIEIGYCFLMTFRSSSKFCSFSALLFLLDNYLMPIFLPYPVASVIFEDRVLGWDAPDGILAPSTFWIMFNIFNFLGMGLCLFYQYYRRKAEKIIYGKESHHVLRCLETPLLFGLHSVFVMTLAYAISSFSGLKKDREYVVGDKVTKTTIDLPNPEVKETTKEDIVEEEASGLLNNEI